MVIITKRLALNMLRKKKGIRVEELLATLEDVRIETSPERASENKTLQMGLQWQVSGIFQQKNC